MVSGRGLGHTGGTLDKLESIPGFRVDLDLDRYQEVLAACGLVMIGQTAEIAPADKFLYALRDATATVESIPLIAASIMSKKLAEGIDGLVLDVKTGGGAFMEQLDDSRALAEAMCAIGQGLGKQMVALITRMDQPLGRAVGNAVEVAECIECLRGDGPADLVEPVDRAGGRDGRDGRPGRLARRGARRSAGGRSPTARPSSGSAGWSRPRGATRVPSTIPSLLPAPRREVVLKAPRAGLRPVAGRAAGRPRDHAAGRGPGADGQPGRSCRRRDPAQEGRRRRRGRRAALHLARQRRIPARRRRQALIRDAYTIAAEPVVAAAADRRTDRGGRRAGSIVGDSDRTA